VNRVFSDIGNVRKEGSTRNTEDRRRGQYEDTRGFSRANISSSRLALVRKAFGKQRASGPRGTQTFTPILDQAAREPTDPMAVVCAFRVGFVATPKPGCGWCWCCCSLLGETSRKLYTHTYIRARTYMRARARAHARCTRTYARAGELVDPSTCTRTGTREIPTHTVPRTPTRARARGRANARTPPRVRTYVRLLACTYTSERGNERSSRTYYHAHTLPRRGKCR